MYLNRAMLLAALIVSASGCATQSYVDENVARLEARLDEQNERINELTETSRQALERATNAGVLAQGDLKADNQNVYLEIQGHTDSTGSAQYNQQLGLQRADSVRRHLHAQGVALDRMATISYGEDAPAEPNSTADGRALNRRVEIVVLN